MGGMLEAMKWLREREVDWADGTTTELAKLGHLELLGWARENGAPWEDETSRASSTREDWARCGDTSGMKDVLEVIRKIQITPT
jgi:hypothetical protein